MEEKYETDNDRICGIKGTVNYFLAGVNGVKGAGLKRLSKYM